MEVGVQGTRSVVGYSWIIHSHSDLATLMKQACENLQLSNDGSTDEQHFLKMEDVLVAYATKKLERKINNKSVSRGDFTFKFTVSKKCQWKKQLINKLNR